MAVVFEFREMSDFEFKREQTAFDKHNIEFGNPPDKQERFGFVATDDGKFVGTSSGLAQKFGDKYGKYFYLTDLLVEKDYRKKGHGKKLLDLLENKVKELGIECMWTWTAEYEGENFYKKQGFDEFCRFENFYPSGHARLGMVKKL